MSIITNTENIVKAIYQSMSIITNTENIVTLLNIMGSLEIIT